MFERKTKKDKAVLLGLNQIFNMHYIPRNEIKQHMTQLISNQCLVGKFKPITGTYETRVQLYMKNALSDPSNIYPMVEKFALDALQVNKMIVDDSYHFHKKTNAIVRGLDKVNPRAIFQIRRYDI